MKKVAFVLVLLMIATASFALESGASNKVGYVKVICPNGTPAPATPFGLPFRFWVVPGTGIPTYGTPSTTPSDIIGDQLNHGTVGGADRITRQDTGDPYWINNSGVPQGNLQTLAAMIPGRAYWYINRTAASRNLIVAGDVANTGNYGATFVTAPAVAGGNVATAYSWRDSRSLSRDSLNLVFSGFLGGTTGTSDRVVAQVGGAEFHVNAAGTIWAGTLLRADPGQAYWIVNKHTSGGGGWNYTYLNTYVPLQQLDPTKAPAIQTIKTPERASKVRTSGN